MFKHATRTPAMKKNYVGSQLPYQLPCNAEALGYQNVVRTDIQTRQAQRDATPPLFRSHAELKRLKMEPRVLPKESAWMDTAGLGEKACLLYGGRRPSKEMGGKCSLAMPVFCWNPKKEHMGVAYPANIRPGFAETAQLLQCSISKAFENNLLYPPTFPSAGEDHKASTLLKIKEKPWISIKWRDPADMETMWVECMGRFNASRAVHQQVNRKTLLKNVIGLGYSIDNENGTLAFDIVKWNIGCYRIQHCGVSRRMGSRPNIVKHLIPDIPTFYKNFGIEVETGCDLLLRMNTRIEKTEMATCTELLLGLSRKRKRGFFQPPTSRKGKGPCSRLSSRKSKGKG